MTMLEIDDSRYSGSGTIVRQAVVFTALTGQAMHLVKARVWRSTPGLRPQHIRVVEAIRQVVGGQTEGGVGQQAFTFGYTAPCVNVVMASQSSCRCSCLAPARPS